MRLIFLGTPADAVPPLRALHDAGHDIAMVVTQPDRRRGRGSDLMPSPVKAAALELGLHVVTPEKSREIVDEVVAANCELGVVVAFGQILPPALLDAVPHGFVNVHFSLLPRWRGAAPVERAMLAGDAETGVCIMRLEEGLDTGPVYARTETPIAPGETAGELHHRLVALGTELLVETLPLVPQVTPFPQDGEATYADQARGGGVPPRLGPPRRRTRARRARRQPAPGRVHQRPRPSPQDLGRPRAHDARRAPTPAR